MGGLSLNTFYYTSHCYRDGKTALARTSSVLLEEILRLAEGAKQPVHPHGVVAIVVPVRRVVDGVVAGAHHRPDLAVDAVVDVCRPHRLYE